MSKTKVLFAYCHELGRCLSIDEARTEFFSRKPEERKRFTFSCSDRNCDVTISGVNYHVKAEDGEKFKAALPFTSSSQVPDVNGSNSPRMQIRTGVQTSQRLISQNEKQSKADGLYQLL